MTVREIVIKTVAPMWVASAGETVPGYDNLGPVFNRLFGTVFGYIARYAQPAGPSLALYRDDGSMRNIPVEALAPLAAQIPEGEGIRVYRLEGGTFATLVHLGPFDTLGASYASLTQWIEGHGYHIAGPAREVYLSMDPGRPDAWVTELQFPVTKA